MNHRQRLRNRLTITIIWVVTCILAGIALFFGTARATVHLTMDGECVRVIMDDGVEVDCSTIDLKNDRYEVVWVASDKDVAIMTRR